MGVRSVAPEGGVGVFRLYSLVVVCDGSVVAGAVEVLASAVVVQAISSCLLLDLLFSDGGRNARRSTSNLKDSSPCGASESTA